MDVLVSAPGTQCGLQAAAAKFKVYLDTEVSIFLLWCRKKNRSLHKANNRTWLQKVD